METILIVEDDAINRKLFQDVLEAHGFETLGAETGQIGIDLAKEHHPALILMDIQMPEMDGMEALKHLKKDPETQKIPVLAITGYAIQGDRERILSWGFDDYMSKPVEIDVLMEKIQKWL